MHVVHIGSDSEFVEFRLPDSYLVEGWAQVRVVISVNSFQGSIQPWLEACDFEIFAKELRALYESLQGKAELSPRDGQIKLQFLALSGGHVQVSGEAWSQACYENKLEFELEIDQSYLPGPLAQLESLNNAVARNDA